METRKILFLEASGGGGHISITTSIIQALKKHNPDIETIRADVIPPIAHKLYQIASRQFVNAFFLLYKATDNHRGEIITSRINRMISNEKLTKIIAESNADLIFSNYALAVAEIPKILEKLGKHVPFIVFVPDPFTVHNIYLTKKADLTLVSTLTAYQQALNSGIQPEQLDVTGHPVREEFTNVPKDTKLFKEQLGLDPDMFTILLGGSGHGAEKTLEILIHLGARPSGNLIKRLIRLTNLDYQTYYKLFFRIYKRQHKNIPPFQVICVCGDNTDLKEELELLKYPSYIKPLIFQKTDKMAELMHASDLVVAKAGPNVLFESVATGKPFLATYHIKGQEDGNIDLIKCAQLGFSEENPQKTAVIIETILKNKRLLDYTKPGISFIREQQKDAAHKIASNILKYLNKA